MTNTLFDAAVAEFYRQNPLLEANIKDASRDSSMSMALRDMFVKGATFAASRPTPSDEVKRLEEDARRYRKYREIASKGDLVGTDDHDEFDREFDRQVGLSHKEEAE